MFLGLPIPTVTTIKMLTFIFDDKKTQFNAQAVIDSPLC